MNQANNSQLSDQERSEKLRNITIKYNEAVKAAFAEFSLKLNENEKLALKEIEILEKKKEDQVLNQLTEEIDNQKLP